MHVIIGTTLITALVEERQLLNYFIDNSKFAYLHNSKFAYLH